jgi:hypothetical protein
VTSSVVLISYRAYPVVAGTGAKAFMGQPLPTIKSENSTSPGVSTPATTVKVEEGVPLPSELVDGKDNVTPTGGVMANGNAGNIEKE